MPDATYLRGENDIRNVAGAAYAANKLIQLNDGSAGILKGQAGVALNDPASWETRGQFTMPKATGVVLLNGGRAYWNFTNLNVTYKKVNSRDFYIGRIVGDAASADTTCVVNLNLSVPYDIDMNISPFLSVPTGTQAVGAFGFPKILGGAQSIELTATSEAQAIDLLSVDKWDKAAKAIVEAQFRIVTNGASTASQFNVGLSNGTSTTDAQAITEQALINIQGGSTAINAQSKDGTTTVAVTDTTTTFTAGSAVANRKEVWIDCRDLTSVKFYVDGVRVLSGSTFKLDAATGPHGLLAHLRKTTGTETAKVVLDRFTVRYNQQT